MPTQLVPSELNSVPVFVAVAGNVAVDQASPVVAAEDTCKNLPSPTATGNLALTSTESTIKIAFPSRQWRCNSGHLTNIKPHRLKATPALKLLIWCVFILSA